MTKGDSFVRSLPLKQAFYDSHERRAYLRATEIARRIVDQPELIEAGRAFLDRFTRPDPHQAAAYDLWLSTLALSPEDIAERLLEDSDQGAALRDSAPVFVTLPKEDLRRIWAASAA